MLRLQSALAKERVEKLQLQELVSRLQGGLGKSNVTTSTNLQGSSIGHGRRAGQLHANSSTEDIKVHTEARNYNLSSKNSVENKENTNNPNHSNPPYHTATSRHHPSSTNYDPNHGGQYSHNAEPEQDVARKRWGGVGEDEHKQREVSHGRRATSVEQSTSHATNPSNATNSTANQRPSLAMLKHRSSLRAMTPNQGV